MSTIWLLDVDGPINANKPRWHAAPRTKYVHADGDSFKFRWAPALIDEIRELSKVVEIRWATTWIPWIFVIEHTLGLPKFKCIDWPPGQIESFAVRCDLKLAAARAVVANGDKLIWTDDDAIPPFGPIVNELEKAGRY